MCLDEQWSKPGGPGDEADQNLAALLSNMKRMKYIVTVSTHFHSDATVARYFFVAEAVALLHFIEV